VKLGKTTTETLQLLPDAYGIFFLFPRLKKRLKGWRHENIEAIQAAATMELTGILKEAFRKRHSPAAFRTCRNARNSVLTAEGTTSKGTGSISRDVEFCIFYRLSLQTLRTKDVFPFSQLILSH
jgi:hypothetical protein